MNPSVARAASRLRHQLRADPLSVATAVLWRGVRRPWVAHWRRRVRNRRDTAPGITLSREMKWARVLLDSAPAVPPELAVLLMRSPCAVFGRSWNAPSETLAAIDPRFGIEAWRLQHLQPLAVLHWQSRQDPRLAATLARETPRPLRDYLVDALREATQWVDGRSPPAAAALRAYPMDHGLRALSLLLSHASLRAAPSDAFGSDDGLDQAVAAAVSHAIDVCLADPEYSGNLSNNHHLTVVACLVVLLASVSAPEGSEASTRIDSQRRLALRWLHRAVQQQFDSDGAHFEYSTGYHMCTLELLALAGLAALEPDAASDSAQRWQRLQSTLPSLAATLAGAVDFADWIARADGTFPLIGDFDASRIVRTHVTYQSRDWLRRCIRGDASVTERYRAPANGRAPLRVTAVSIEVTASSDAARMARSIFDLPPPAAGEGTHGHVPPTLPVEIATELSAKDLGLLGRAVGADACSPGSAVRYCFALPAPAERLQFRHFEQAGLVVARGDGLLVTLRSGKAGQRGIGTHSHLDHLASDVWIAGAGCIADPGSWCYGASTGLRNRYRGNSGHFTPFWASDWSAALRHPFHLDQAPPAASLGYGTQACWGVVRAGNDWVCRLIAVLDHRLVVIDAASRSDLKPCPLNQLPVPADGYFGPLLREGATDARTACAA